MFAALGAFGVLVTAAVYGGIAYAVNALVDNSAVDVAAWVVAGALVAWSALVFTLAAVAASQE